MNQPEDNVAAFERALALRETLDVQLQLYVAGMGPRSTRAIADLRKLCTELGERCSVEIVDIYERPAAAAEAQIVAVPALVRCRPLPRRKLIGTIGSPIDVARRLGFPVRDAEEIV